MYAKKPSVSDVLLQKKRLPSHDEVTAMNFVEQIQHAVAVDKDEWAATKLEYELIELGHLRVIPADKQCLVQRLGSSLDPTGDMMREEQARQRYEAEQRHAAQQPRNQPAAGTEHEENQQLLQVDANEIYGLIYGQHEKVEDGPTDIRFADAEHACKKEENQPDCDEFDFPEEISLAPSFTATFT